jgi:hypothetical protein
MLRSKAQRPFPGVEQRSLIRRHRSALRAWQYSDRWFYEKPFGVRLSMITDQHTRLRCGEPGYTLGLFIHWWN